MGVGGEMWDGCGVDGWEWGVLTKQVKSTGGSCLEGEGWEKHALARR